MLYLKEANIADIQKEYEVITRIPSDENGFTNEYEGCSFEEFKEQILPSFINHANGFERWICSRYELFLMGWRCRCWLVSF